MCGIVGYTGRRQAAPFFLDGLAKLEYRGYDSAGLAVRDDKRLADVVKVTGRLKNLAEKTDDGCGFPGTCGIGHTRWVTHGEPSQIDAHPHVSGNCAGSGSGQVESDAEPAEKGGYEHFMMKGIHEQPKGVKDTLNIVLKGGKIDLEAVGLGEDEIRVLDSIAIVACGSAWHAGVASQYVIEDLAEIPVRVELASKFRYRRPKLKEGSQLVAVISQSGETADTLAALRLAKDKGVKILAVVNIVGSSIARKADYVFYTVAGPEIAFATTKAYNAQLIAGYCLAIEMGRVIEIIDEEKYKKYISEI